LSVLTSWRRFTTFGSQASKIEVRGFEAYLSTENIELDKAKEIVSCSDVRDIGEDHYTSLPTLQRSIDLKLVNTTSTSKDTIKRQYRLEFPEIKHELDWKNDRHPKDARQTICSIQLEFKQKNSEAKSTYYLDSLPIDNLRAIYGGIFITEIGGGILLKDDILPCQTMTFTDAEKFKTSDFAEKCSSYYNFYNNAQAKLQQLILKPLSANGDIAFVPQVNLEQNYLNLAVSDLNNYENYWRKVRLGFNTKTVQDFKFDRGNKFGTKLGSVIGFFSAANPLVGLAVGGVVGSVFDKSPSASFETKEIPLPLPIVTDSAIVLLDTLI
jgi:hypothetical protein